MVYHIIYQVIFFRKSCAPVVNSEMSPNCDDFLTTKRNNSGVTTYKNYSTTNRSKHENSAENIIYILACNISYNLYAVFALRTKG